MVKVEKLGNIEGLGNIVSCYAPFDEQLKLLEKAGARFPYVMSVEQMACMRLNGGPLDPARTCLAPVQAKNSPVILAMVSPLIENPDMAEQVVHSYRNRNYFVTKNKNIYDKLYAKAEEDRTKEPEKRRAIILPEKGNYLIEPDSEEAESIFRKVQKDYFTKFAKKGVTFYPIREDFVNEQNGTVINYLWFWGPDDDSGLGGDDGYLYSSTATLGRLGC